MAGAGIGRIMNLHKESILVTLCYINRGLGIDLGGVLSSRHTYTLRASVTHSCQGVHPRGHKQEEIMKAI